MMQSALTFFILSFIDGLVQLPIVQPPLVNKQSHPAAQIYLPPLSLSELIYMFYLLLPLFLWPPLFELLRGSAQA